MPLDIPTRAPLIGRDDELDRLAVLIGVRGAGSMPAVGVLLSGDAGIGKTRLLAALRGLASDAGHRVLVGHCLDFGDSALPYLAVTELFGQLDADASTLADKVAAAHPTLLRVLPGRPGRGPDAGPDLPAGTDRGELFSAVHAALETVAAVAPLLVVIEDLHWADQSTRELLSFLFTRRFDGPITIIGSYRSDDLHRRHPLRPAAAGWARLPGVERFALGPLPDPHVRSLVRALHAAPMPEVDVHTVVERAEGNAFFAEELVAATALDHSAVPRDLAGLLLVRIDQLDDPARHVVRVASVAGRGISHNLLAEVVDLTTPELEAGVRAAVERNVLVPSGDGYAFRHAMLGEAVYDDLLPGERVRLHSAYVRALLDDRAHGSAAELARHARAGHDQVTALHASIRAGDEAAAVGGPDEALGHYRMALELADEAAALDPGDVDVVELTVKASAAATAAGHVDKAIALVTDRLDRLPDSTSPTKRAELLVAHAAAAVLSDATGDILGSTTAALDLVPADPPSPLRARLLGVHAHALAEHLRDDEAIRWSEEALFLATELGLRDVVADVTTTMADVQERRGDPAASRAALERVVADALLTGDPAALRGLHNLGGLHLEHGRLAEAFDAFRRGAAQARALGLSWAPYGLDARLLAGLVAYQRGEWQTALDIANVAGESPTELAEATLTIVRLTVAAGRGARDARSLLARVRPWWQRDGVIAVHAGGAAIDLLGDAGDLDAAVAVHADVVECLSALWQPEFQARNRLSALLLAQLAAAARRSAAAERTALAELGNDLIAGAELAAARPASLGLTRGPEGDAWLARANAEQLRLRWLVGVDVPPETELVEAWSAAVAAFERYGHVFELARSQARLAAVLHAAGDPTRARPLVEAARATARRLGAEPLLAELRLLGGAVRLEAPGRPDETLTAREREVLGLVAEGRSNSQIAGQLYISAKTVSVHVSNILAKLTASGRTEAVAIARRRGLLPD